MELQFEESLNFFLASWRDDWLQKVLGGSESASRTSEHAAAISIRQQAAEHGGKGGVHLRECVNLIFGQNGYLAYRRELRLPEEYDFDIQPAEFIAFRLWRRARSKAASGHCVILAVTRTMYVAVRYFGCPVDLQCALLLKPPKVVVVPATPADCPPDELVVEIERMAAAAVAAKCLHVCTDYLIAFQLMMFSRSRKEDFSTAKDIRLEKMCSLQCVVGSMNMKDGSVQAWWAVPATGMLGEWTHLHAWIERVRLRGYVFPQFSAPRGFAGDVMHARAVIDGCEAPLSRVDEAWRSVVAHVDRRRPDIQLSSLRKLTLHSPRHWLAFWAAIMMWSLPAREEIGRWVGDLQLVPGESRDTRVRSTRGICAVRYAQEASRMLQIGLVSDLVQAVKELQPRSDSMVERAKVSKFYKMH